MYQETLVILKPDALERNLNGALIDRFERAELKVLDIRYYAKVDEALLRKHYPDAMAESLGRKAQQATTGIVDPVAHGMKVLERLRRYFTRSPVIAIKFGGENAIQVVRRVTGYTDPATAEQVTQRRRRLNSPSGSPEKVYLSFLPAMKSSTHCFASLSGTWTGGCLKL